MHLFDLGHQKFCLLLQKVAVQFLVTILFYIKLYPFSYNCNFGSASSSAVPQWRKLCSTKSIALWFLRCSPPFSRLPLHPYHSIGKALQALSQVMVQEVLQTAFQKPSRMICVLLLQAPTLTLPGQEALSWTVHQVLNTLSMLQS